MIAILDTLPTVIVHRAVAVSPMKVWSDEPVPVRATAVPACAFERLYPNANVLFVKSPKVLPLSVVSFAMT